MGVQLYLHSTAIVAAARGEWQRAAHQERCHFITMQCLNVLHVSRQFFPAFELDANVHVQALLEAPMAVFAGLTMLPPCSDDGQGWVGS